MKITKIVFHILAWCVYMATYALLWRGPGESIVHGFFSEVALLPFKVLLVYTSLFFLLPRFLYQRKYYQFILWFLMCSMVFGISHQFYVEVILPVSVSGTTHAGMWNWTVLTKRMTYINSTALFAITFEMIRNWYRQKEYSSKIANEKTVAELKLLKNQLHPHFFFNTLNTLYALSLVKSDLTSSLILQLSDLMRFIVTKSDNDLVWLNEEVNFISNYIDMEKLRYEDKVFVEFTNRIPEDNNIRIPPLLLITFIENAFKHGVSQERKMARVNVLLEIKEDKIHYSVINSVVSENDLRETKQGIKGGIGLNNLTKRLELIFGQDFNLRIQSGISYTAMLTIPAK